MFLPGLVTLLCLYLVYYRVTNRKYKHLPSAGLCLPLVGHAHKLFSPKALADPVNSLWNLWKEHQREGLLWVRVLTLDTLFVGDYETLKHLFNHPDMQERLTPSLHEILSENRRIKNPEMAGVLASSGSTWTEQRRFTLRTLRDFGFGKSEMEEMIKEEVNMFIDVIKKTEGEPFDFGHQFNLPIVNALWRICMGQRFDYDNPQFVSIVEKVTRYLKLIASPIALITVAYPRLAKLFPTLLKRGQTIATHDEVLGMIWKSIKDHEHTRDPNDPRDFTDKALAEINQTTDPSSSFYGARGKENLANTLLDLFLAGSETTSTTLTWAVLYMARYPEVQRKVQAELDRVVGTHRMPGLQDRSSLPYTEAVIMEIQRYSNMTPLGVAHLCRRDTTVNGLTIPAGSRLFGLFAEVHKGPYWGDGELFRPERFLDSEGRCRKEERLIPFSTGRRQCLGETLAKAELFLFFTGMIQQFSLWPEVEGEPPSEDYCNGVTVLPKSFRLRLSGRT